MVTVRLSKSFTVGGAEHFESHVYGVLDELHSLEESLGTVFDPDLAASETQAIVTFSISATAETIDEARSVADSAIRSAIHAAGGATPDWLPADHAERTVGAFTFQEEHLQIA